MTITAKPAAETFPVCVAVLSVILPVAACNSSSRSSGMTPPSPLAPPSAPLTLSGQVFEVTPGGRVPAANFPVLVVVAAVSGCSAPCRISITTWTRESTTTGLDGRYHFPQLPAGWAIVLAKSATHRQVCGAGAVLAAATQLDVEITARANPQPSVTMPPLRVNGQIYETTPAGRVGIAGAVIYMEALAGDSPFLYEVHADKDGRYTVCGIPPNWPIAFWTGQTGYETVYGDWHQFSADTTFDIELKRQ